MGLRNITATVKRLSGTTIWTKGIPSDAALLPDIPIKCSVQPLNPREMEMQPEGRRNKEVFKLFTSVELFTVEDRNPDKIVVFGDTYEVVSVERWKNSIIPHYKAVIVKQ